MRINSAHNWTRRMSRDENRVGFVQKASPGFENDKRLLSTYYGHRCLASVHWGFDPENHTQHLGQLCE